MDETSGFFTIPEIPTHPDGSKLLRMEGGEGGCCELYKVEKAGRFRVLKCLKSVHRGDPLYEGLLRKEFEIGYSLSHNNICQYFDFREVEGLGHCIEMEWVDGRTLEAALAEGKMPRQISDKVLDELCDALSYMHSKQIFHRDLKPSNILLTYSGDTVKLIDFGLSDSDSHSILKEPAGTAVFSAPEVLEGGRADARSDIYSLGLVMFTISGKYRRVARKCCEKRPSNRYQSVQQVKNALHSNVPLVQGILFLLIVFALAVMSLLPSRKPTDPLPPAGTVDAEAPVSVEEETSDAVGEEASKVTPPSPARQTPRKQPSSSAVEKDAAAIDEIFRHGYV